MTTATIASKFICVHANLWDSAVLEIIGQSDKAIQVRNEHCRRTCWIPKSGLKPYKPGVEGYEQDFVLTPWFRDAANEFQLKVLNLAE